MELITFDHDLNMRLIAKYFKVDVGEKFTCNLSKKEIKKIGQPLIIKWEADIKEKTLNIPTNPEKKDGWIELHCRGLFFGIYCIFTEPTQHFYCKTEDISYILGLAKCYQDLTGKTVSDFYSEFNDDAMNLAISDEFKHLKQICSKLNVKIPAGLSDMNEIKEYLNKNHYICECNYFYFVRMGAYVKHYYEYLLNIKNR